MKEMPERIYLFDCNDAMTTQLEGDTEYIRKDIVDKMIKTAKDEMCKIQKKQWRNKYDNRRI